MKAGGAAGALLALALAVPLALAPPPLKAMEMLRLPWVFSDEPYLCADFAFSPGSSGATAVEIALGGRFADFGVPAWASRAPKLDITCEFTAPSELEHSARVLRTVVDLADTLKEHSLGYSLRRFGSSSPLVYKAVLKTELPPADYNVSIDIKDPALGLVSRRTLHLFVPAVEGKRWQVGDLKFIAGMGEGPDPSGRMVQTFDPNPWRQVGGGLGWDLLVAYTDTGPRPSGALTRVHRIRRLRGDTDAIWEESGPAPEKAADQVWLVRVPAKTVEAWKGGTYVLEVEERCSGKTVSGSKTFEVLP